MNTNTKSRPGPHVGFILEQHLEEVAFLNVQRRYLLFAPDVPLDGFRSHDERITAHWDGLVVGGPASVELAQSRLTAFDPWDVFAAVSAWLQLGGPSAEEILEEMANASEDNLAGWREALRRMPAAVLEKLLPVAATDEAESGVLAALVYARSWHGLQDPSALKALVKDDCTELRRTLARVLGWGVVDTETASGMLQDLVDDPELPVARAALWTAAMLGNGEAQDHCRELVKDTDADPFQIQTLGLLGQPEDANLLRPLLDKPGLLPVTARAIGYLGSIKAVPWLIDRHTTAEDEEIDEAVTAGLEILLGDLPDLGEETLGQWWPKIESHFSGTKLWLRGRERPWKLAPEDEPMEALWLSSLRTRDQGWAWLQREIPDGFFTAGDNIEALPGE